MRFSIIIPFHRNLEHLRRVLAGLQPLPADAEVLVVADGAIDECAPVAASAGARVVTIPGPSGPAVARNRGADAARGDILVFIDADVVAPRDNLDRLREVFSAEPELAAVFGAYDERPAEPNLISQYKNLAHSYIHQTSSPAAQTFWAGLGAIRRPVFTAVGGFDERYRRPSIEDIELGYRLSGLGYQIRLDARLRACHLKRWTLTSLVVTDVRDRGIPWTQLILRSGRAHNDLNIRNAYRVSVMLSYLLVLLAAAWPVTPLVAPAMAAVLVALYGLNRPILRFFTSRRGLWFTLRVVPLHLLYHLYNGVSFAVGGTIYIAGRSLGIRLPGAIPLEARRRPINVPIVH